MSEKGNIFLRRYMPDCRCHGAFADQVDVPIVKDNFGNSITDKESYRLSLVNGIGASSGVGVNPACYMFPDGKYDINKDISPVLRPDLSPVQIDDYIKYMEQALKDSDQQLKDKIEKDITYAEQLKKRAEAEQKSNESGGDS